MRDPNYRSSDHSSSTASPRNHGRAWARALIAALGLGFVAASTGCLAAAAGAGAGVGYAIGRESEDDDNGPDDVDDGADR